MIKKELTTEALHDYLFKVWESQYFVYINGTCFNTEKVTLAYDPEFDTFEIYNINDTYLENVLCFVNLKCIKTINNTQIVLDMGLNGEQEMNRKELREIIKHKWNTSYWMRINGFLFFTSYCCQKTTDEDLLIYNEETLTIICLKEINSLIIDDEVIL